MKRLGMLFLAGVLVLTNSFFVFGQTTDSVVSEEQGNEYNYSVQEIVDEVNQKYGTDIQLDEPFPSERTITDVNKNKLTKKEFSAILNKKAAKIAEHRAAVRKQFENRTGRAPFEKPENVNYNDSARAATIKNYSKTKEIEYIPVTVTGKVITESFTRFYDLPTVKTKDKLSVIPGGLNRRVSGTDRELIDSGRTCAVYLDIFIDYYDAELGKIESYSDSGYGEFHAS